MKKQVLFLTITLLVLPIFCVYAQNNDQTTAEDLAHDAWQAPPPTQENSINCFDYYKFQSVSVSAGPDNQAYQPGTQVHFSGTIANNNNYPIVNGNLFVRISKSNPNFMEEGQFIVDEFVAVEDIAIESNGKKNVDFTWPVPVDISNGSYVVDYFFSVGKKFNLGGLPFSNDVTAGMAKFDINSTISDYVSFERMGTTINGEKYHQVGAWPNVDLGKEVVVKNVLHNSYATEKSVTISQDLYRWDSLNENDRLDTKKMTVLIPAHSSQEITYTIPQVAESVYYLKTVATYDQDVTSVINVRFTSLSAHARLNFPAVTKFPVSKGDQFTLFSCYHNSSYSEASGTVHVSLTDKDGKMIDEAEYKGKISSAMAAVKQDITAKKDYDYMKLTAQITDDNGAIVDHYETVYDCAKIGKCNASSSDVGKDRTKKNILAIVVIAIVSLVVIMVIIKIMGKVHSHKFGLFFFGAMLACSLMVGRTAYAVGDGSVLSWQNYYFYNNMVGLWPVLISAGSITMHHNMSIASGSANIGCGGSVTFGYNPQLEFTAFGGAWDTPYGTVCSNYYSPDCFGGTMPGAGQLLGSSSGDGLTQPGWIWFTAGTPKFPLLTSSNNNIMTCSGATCTAKPGASGIVTITAHLNNSIARVWSVVQVYKDRCNVKKISCSGKILGLDRCIDINKISFHRYSPTEDRYSCGGTNVQSTYPSLLSEDKVAGSATVEMNIPAPSDPMSWTISIGSCAANGACNPASARTDYAYTATGPSTPLCSAGTPSPATVLFPAGAYGASSAVSWTCAGTGGGTTATCSAQRNAPSITCGTASGTTEYNSVPPVADLCSSDGTAVAPDHSKMPPIPRFVDGQWQWACQHNIVTSLYSGMCSAPTCMTGRPITATTPVIINRDNDQHTVVSVSCPNLCCEVVREGTTIPVTICTGGTSSAEIQIPVGGANLQSMCWFDDGNGKSGDSGDTPKTPGNTVTVQTACTAHSCNAQHTCQATMQIANSLDDCSSTCNSNADCSTGRMIETRP
jgi:hypothetical protein